MFGLMRTSIDTLTVSLAEGYNALSLAGEQVGAVLAP
jgi:hypothetical protein